MRPLLALPAALLVAACASAAPGASSSAADRITRDQLAASQTLSLFDIVERLHPEWLSSRGPSSLTDPGRGQLPSVYFQGTHIGDANSLRRLSVSDAEELRYWRPGEAATRFGMGHPRGVIEVIGRSPHP